MRRTSSRQAERQAPLPCHSICPTTRSNHDEPVIPIRRPISAQNGWPDEVQIKELPLLHRVDPRVNGDWHAPAPQSLNVNAMSGRKPVGHDPYFVGHLSRVRALAGLPRGSHMERRYFLNAGACEKPASSEPLAVVGEMTEYRHLHGIDAGWQRNLPKAAPPFAASNHP
ncbi:hypothetical protein JVX98_31585 (plasmid) [Ensifer sp. PDNC004]|uniref:hypothetical protein n=1 Tax=Ensifer sp. PDNC004 TaxID=2811423 RepID=UPI001964F6C5|nr:hypothetical protein [Ensifer sp. PDNC004]QRY70584.1 hypothetical protein JVX98_31585 [Ensifer sp. PDNC004]